MTNCPVLGLLQEPQCINNYKYQDFLRRIKDENNFYDWASRPYGDNAFEGKPAAVMGASIGMGGTMRAQYHLRQCFVFLNMHPLNQPEVMVPFAHEKIDQSGRVTDQKTKEKIRELLESLVVWVRRLKQEP